MSDFMRDLANEANKSGRTWNGAVSNASISPTGGKLTACLEYFSKCGSYNHRSQEAVDADMRRIFADDEGAALATVFGLRLITRKLRGTPEGCENETTIGMGRRDEFYKCCVWLLKNRPTLFYANLPLVPLFGSWKDLLQPPLLPEMMATHSGFLLQLIAANLDDALLVKYLPTIRSRKKGRTDRDRERSDFGRALCRHLGIEERQYRKLKAEGVAHEWQRQMSRRQFNDVDFKKIPGKALLNAMSHKGKKDKLCWVERRGQLERFRTWLQAQEHVKFTGQPYELLRAAYEKPLSGLQMLLYDRQFETCIRPLKEINGLGNVLVALDTSGSMGCEVMKGVRAVDVCLSLGVAFSMINTGAFKDAVAMFDSTSRIVFLEGGFTKRVKRLEKEPIAWGSTDFQSLVDAVCKVRARHPNRPAEEFAQTLLVVSDMQFNPALGVTEDTNYEIARQKFALVNLPPPRIVWWQVNGARTSDFPCLATDGGCHLLSGFDPSMLRAVMQAETKKLQEPLLERQQVTPMDTYLAWLSQPIFRLLQTEHPPELIA